MSPLPFSGVVEELTPAPDVEQALLALAGRRHCIFLDSARQDPQLGRYSYLAVDPFDFVELSADAAVALGTTGQNVFRDLACRLAPFATERNEGLPPFQG